MNPQDGTVSGTARTVSDGKGCRSGSLSHFHGTHTYRPNGADRNASCVALRHRVAHTDRYTPSLASVVRYSGRKIRAEVADELDTRYLFEVNTRGVDVRLHDLRRTARTLMSRLGVAEDLAELAIGHVRDDLVRRYNKDAAWEGRRDAFTRVSAHIEAAVGAREGAAVIPLRG